MSSSTTQRKKGIAQPVSQTASPSKRSSTLH